MTDADADLFGFMCARPDCWEVVVRPLGTPARSVFCSEYCETAVEEDYTLARERLEHAQRLLRQSWARIGAFGRPEDAPVGQDAVQAARMALAEAGGARAGVEASGGPQTDREAALFETLTRLAEATTPLVALLSPDIQALASQHARKSTPSDAT